MSNLKRLVEAAIGGGYDKYALNKGWKLESYATVSMPNHYFIKLYDDSDIHIAALLLDPSFWQAIGKAKRWDDKCLICDSKANGLCSAHIYSPWQSRMHRFLDLLIDGKSIDEAAGEIMSNNK